MPSFFSIEPAWTFMQDRLIIPRPGYDFRLAVSLFCYVREMFTSSLYVLMTQKRPCFLRLFLPTHLSVLRVMQNGLSHCLPTFFSTIKQSFTLNRYGHVSGRRNQHFPNPSRRNLFSRPFESQKDSSTFPEIFVLLDVWKTTVLVLFLKQ